MPPDDVPDFVPEDACHFVLTVQQSQQPKGDKDLPAGESKRVDRLRVSQKVELKVVGTLINLGVGMNELFSDGRDQILVAFVGIQTAMLSSHLGRRVQAEGDFFLWAQGDSLDTSGNRIFEPLGSDVIADDCGKSDNDSDEQSTPATWLTS
jgi:hypothetical protein